jgi:hypothetical protein
LDDIIISVPLWVLLMYLRALLCWQLTLAAENLALRQQLATYHRSAPKPKLRDRRNFC